VEPAGAPPPERDRPAELEQRARRAVGQIAPRLSQPPERIASGLEELAVLFSSVGVGRHAETARAPRLAAALTELRADMHQWSRAHQDESGADAARIAESADVTLACARVVLGEVQGLRRGIVELMRAWLQQPEPLTAAVARPDWLLDGWERICLLWRTADHALGRDATLAEMASLIPPLPKEAAEWAGIDLPGIGDAGLHRRKVSLMEDWRTGVTVYDLIARNEHLRALAP
jgi:hypothetical protein